jgi:cell division septal protein FtsQ
MRRHWWRWLRRGLGYGLIAAALAYGAHLGMGRLAHARILVIDRVVVQGNEQLATGEVLALLAGLRGDSLLWTDLNRWRQRLLSSPWVRDATLRRSLPSTVEVTVLERRPIGLGRGDGRLYLVDDHGVIIDEYGPEHEGFDLPIIDGLTEPGGQAAAGDGYRAVLASRLLAAVRPNAAIARRLSQIDVQDPHNAKVILSGDAAVLQLGEERFLSRLESYLELAPALRERVPEIDSVDLRFDGRVYVRPAEKRHRARGPLVGSRR